MANKYKGTFSDELSSPIEHLVGEALIELIEHDSGGALLLKGKLILIFVLKFIKLQVFDCNTLVSTNKAGLLAFILYELHLRLVDY